MNRHAVSLWSLWVAVFLAPAICLAPPVAVAQDFRLTDARADAQASIDLPGGGFPGFPIEQTDTLNLPLDIAAFASAQAQVGGVFDARAAGFQTAYGLNAAFAEVRGFPAELNTGYEVFAETDYRVRFGSAQNLRGTRIPFEFVINGGELRIEDFASWSPRALYALYGASVRAEITLFPQGIWRFGARLTKDPTTGDPLVLPDLFGNQDDFGLDVFPALAPFMDGADAVVTIPEIRGTVLIDGGEFAGAGQLFVYRMEGRIAMGPGGFAAVPALAGITDPFALGTPDDMSDDLGGAFDPAGVQLFLGGQPLSSYPVSAIPEPTRAVLMLCGLAGVWLVCRRQRRPSARAKLRTGVGRER